MAKIIIFLVIIGFSVVQTLVKAAKDKAKNQNAVNADPGRKQRVQNEIESFLAEATGGKPAQRPTKKRRPQQSRPPSKPRRSPPQKQNQPAAKQRTKSGSKRDVGSGINEHVDEYIGQHVAEHIDHDVDEYVEATIVDSVNEHLGRRELEMPSGAGVTRSRQTDAAESVAALLRSPQGVRNAILVNEILSRPAVLRRR